MSTLNDDGDPNDKVYIYQNNQKINLKIKWSKQIAIF